MRRVKSAFTKKVLIAIVVIGALAILLMYGLVYMKYADMTDELEASNRKLQNSITELKKYYDNQQFYIEDASLMEEKIQKILEIYPSDARAEDVLMLAVETQENCKVSYEVINIEEIETVHAIEKDVVVGANIEGYDKALTYKAKNASYLNCTDYANLKGSVEQIFKSSNRIGIKTIAYEKPNEKDCLEGTIDVVFYTVSGTDKEYVCPDIEEYLSGTEDIFNIDYK